MNPTTSSGIGAMLSTGIQRKNLHIEQAVNGFVVSLGHHETQIANNKEEMLAIVAEYIDRK